MPQIEVRQYSLKEHTTNTVRRYLAGIYSLFQALRHKVVKEVKLHALFITALN
jgi:hypothetical protein